MGLSRERQFGGHLNSALAEIVAMHALPPGAPADFAQLDRFYSERALSIAKLEDPVRTIDPETVDSRLLRLHCTPEFRGLEFALAEDRPPSRLDEYYALVARRSELDAIQDWTVQQYSTKNSLPYCCPPSGMSIPRLTGTDLPVAKRVRALVLQGLPRDFPIAIGDFRDTLDIRELEDLPPERLSRTLRIIDEAATFLRPFSGYLEWINRVISAIVPTFTETTKSISGSAALVPGLVHCNFPIPVIEMAEVLVHEASHQYFHLLERHCALTSGDDGVLFYSPIKEAERSLQIILLTYHAFANVYLFLSAAGSSPGVAFPHRRRQRLSDDLSTLDSHISGSHGLTDAGEVFWVELRDAVKHARRRV